MYINHSGEPGMYKDQFPTKVNWAAATVPTLDGIIKGVLHFILVQLQGKLAEDLTL